MCQDRLDALSLLCIEADMLRQVSSDEIIKDFTIRKSRKKLFKFWHVCKFSLVSKNKKLFYKWKFCCRPLHMEAPLSFRA